MTSAPARPACPGCDSVMSPFQVDGRPLAYCTFCGGAWIDGDVLEKVARRPLSFDALDGAGTTRRCVSCKLTLDPLLIDATPVERCRLCRGIYLDHGELEELARRRVGLRRDEPSTPLVHHEHDFCCPGCGERKPLAEGTVTGRGYACMSCAPAFDGSSAVLPPPRGTTLNPPLVTFDDGSVYVGRGVQIGFQLDILSSLLFGGDD